MEDFDEDLDGLSPSRDRTPRLIIFGDPDARVDPAQGVLGVSLSHRMARAAAGAGFGQVCVGPGVRSLPEGAVECSVGEPFGSPALLIWEGSYIDPALLRLMIEHPLEDDERFAIYDELGRPAGCFCGHLDRVPALVPIAEELDLPAAFGPASVVRVVDREDMARACRLVARSETQLELDRSSFNLQVGLRSLAWLARAGLSLAQLEVLALLVVVASAPLLLLAGWPGLVLAGLCLLLGVHVARLLKPLGALGPQAGPPIELPAVRGAGREELRDEPYTPGETLAALVRPVGHVAFITSATYLLIDPVDRSSVAALVLLAVGGSAALLNGARVRHLLRQGAAERLALVRVERLVERLGLRMPGPLVQAPLLELCVAVSCLFGEVAVPWTVCVIAAASRLWPWFVAPVESAQPVATPQSALNSSHSPRST